MLSQNREGPDGCVWNLSTACGRQCVRPTGPLSVPKILFKFCTVSSPGVLTVIMGRSKVPPPAGKSISP